MKKILVAIMLLLSLLVLCSCASRPEGMPDTIEVVDISSGKVFRVWYGKAFYARVIRFVDSEAGTVCYLYTGGGISCLPTD